MTCPFSECSRPRRRLFERRRGRFWGSSSGSGEVASNAPESLVIIVFAIEPADFAKAGTLALSNEAYS